MLKMYHPVVGRYFDTLIPWGASILIPFEPAVVDVVNLLVDMFARLTVHCSVLHPSRPSWLCVCPVSPGVQGARPVRHRLDRPPVATPVRRRQGGVCAALHKEHRSHVSEPLQMRSRGKGAWRLHLDTEFSVVIQPEGTSCIKLLFVVRLRRLFPGCCLSDDCRHWLLGTWGKTLDEWRCLLFLQSKIIRVLNLWQKNNVFPYTVVQPLLDLASDPQNPNVIAAGKYPAAISKLLSGGGCYAGRC